jgi:hypothetical protein
MTISKTIKLFFGFALAAFKKRTRIRSLKRAAKNPAFQAIQEEAFKEFSKNSQWGLHLP